MEEKRARILETAIELAENGGFEAVRLRDVAAQADVALGTLYKRFRSKEDLLIGALELEAEKLERKLVQRPITGETQVERMVGFFDALTKTLFRKPNLGRAVIRALTAGDQELAAKVVGFHELVTRMLLDAMRGNGTKDEKPEATPNEHLVGFLSTQIWFAALVGWMSGLHSKEGVYEQLRVAIEILLRGVDKEEI